MATEAGDAGVEVEKIQSRRSKKEQLEVELAYLRWLRTQNGSRMRATLQETRAIMQRDERDMAEGDDIPRSVWLRYVAESEKTAPIRTDKAFVERLARENVQAAELAKRRKREQARQAKLFAKLNDKVEESQRRSVEYRARKEEMELKRAAHLAASLRDSALEDESVHPQQGLLSPSRDFETERA